jgi:ATP-dependent helicase/DNAse subunit B
VAQRGNIYHRILECVYRAPGVEDPADLRQLLAALPGVARQVLDEAPRREGFRATAWWRQTRAEIEEHVRRSLEALHSPALAGDYVPIAHEVKFDRPQELVISEGNDLFRLHGRIDRVDRAPDGRVRIIDFKSGGKSGYTNQALSDGKKIQLALYALAARDALHLGEPADGFYWHVQQAEPSSLRLAKYCGEGGASALEVAAQHAWAAVRSVRRGEFVPAAPDEGCPSFCPAVAFCWSYRPGFGG